MGNEVFVADGKFFKIRKVKLKLTYFNTIPSLFKLLFYIVQRFKFTILIFLMTIFI
jgi:hypothetical protein